MKSERLDTKYPALQSVTPFELWELFFTDGMLSEIVTQTNLFARRDRNNAEFSTDAQEIVRFLGLLILSGYICLPCNRETQKIWVLK